MPMKKSLKKSMGKMFVDKQSLNHKVLVARRNFQDVKKFINEEGWRK